MRRALGFALAALLAGAACADAQAQAARPDGPRPFAVRPGFENARQSEFLRTPTASHVHYRYAWTQPDGTPETIAFAFERATVERLRDAFEGFDPARLGDAAYGAAVEAAKRARADVRLSLRRSARGIEVEAEGTNETAMRGELARVQDAWTRAKTEALAKAGMIERAPNVVEVDLLRQVGDYVSVMRPLAEAFAARTRGLDDRHVVELLLGFFQSIPYQDIEPPRGRGFRTPIGLIEANGGDCDTKSVAFAATLRALRPGLGLALVAIEHHVLAAAELPPAGGEYWLRLSGRTFLFMEPVGPGLLPIGRVGQETRKEVAAGRYRVLVVPQ
jgi:hypothetical protein